LSRHDSFLPVPSGSFSAVWSIDSDFSLEICEINSPISGLGFNHLIRLNLTTILIYLRSPPPATGSITIPPREDAERVGLESPKLISFRSGDPEASSPLRDLIALAHAIGFNLRALIVNREARASFQSRSISETVCRACARAQVRARLPSARRQWRPKW
jgi:hypothetical protein